MTKQPLSHLDAPSETYEEALYRRYVPLAHLDTSGVIVRVVAMEIDGNAALVEAVNTGVQWRVSHRRIRYI